MLPPAAVDYGYAAVPPVLPGWIDASHRQPADSPVAWHAGLPGAIYLIGAMIGALGLGVLEVGPTLFGRRSWGLLAGRSQSPTRSVVS